MTNIYTLDKIRTAAKKKYAPVTITLSDETEVELRGLIRLGEKEREKVKSNLEVMELLDKGEGLDDMSDSDKELVADGLNEILKQLAPGLDGRRLVSEIDSDLPTLMEVIGTWIEESQLGGSLALADLLDKYGEVLIPDLKHYYGMDLRDLFSEEHPLEPRWVLAHIIYLPTESAYVAERRGGQQFRGWNPSWYALVATVNGIRALNHMYILSHIGKNSSKPKAPEPYPIPEVDRSKTEAPKANSFAGIAASMMAASRRKKAERRSDG
ncbi:tail assembly chaperone [Mycobacterium phage Roary]|nr:tail assembly chaperone [Mycobacterium phage Roary]